jgi:hypothetical protein
MVEQFHDVYLAHYLDPVFLIQLRLADDLERHLRQQHATKLQSISVPHTHTHTHHRLEERLCQSPAKCASQTFHVNTAFSLLWANVK